MKNDKKIYSQEDMARLLHVSTRTVRDYMNRELLPYTHFHGKRAFTLAQWRVVNMALVDYSMEHGSGHDPSEAILQGYAIDKQIEQIDFYSGLANGRAKIEELIGRTKPRRSFTVGPFGRVSSMA